MWEGKIPEKDIKKAVSLTLTKEIGEEKEVSLTFVPENMIRELNLKYRKKDSSTDVLAFSLTDKFCSTENLLGEIVICPDVASLNAQERGHSLEDELLLLVIHGTLHLLGYTDETDSGKKTMVRKEKEILKLLGKGENIV